MKKLVLQAIVGLLLGVGAISTVVVFALLITTWLNLAHWLQAILIVTFCFLFIPTFWFFAGIIDKKINGDIE